jgi:hypothetical protein
MNSIQSILINNASSSMSFLIKSAAAAGRLTSSRNTYKYPVTFERNSNPNLKVIFYLRFSDVVFPPNGEYKLPTMPPEPTFDPALREPDPRKEKWNNRPIDSRGYEIIHTEVCFSKST